MGDDGGQEEVRPCRLVPAPCTCRAPHHLAEPARSPRRRGGPGALRAPPARADHAVPLGAAARSQFHLHTEASTGRELPRFIKDEFNAFLECGILAHGFLRLRCGDCGHDKLLAFSCKRRGFCPSCGARRMAQRAVHLVDHLSSHLPAHRWQIDCREPDVRGCRAALHWRLSGPPDVCCIGAKGAVMPSIGTGAPGTPRHWYMRSASCGLLHIDWRVESSKKHNIYVYNSMR